MVSHRLIELSQPVQRRMQSKFDQNVPQCYCKGSRPCSERIIYLATPKHRCGSFEEKQRNLARLKQLDQMLGKSYELVGKEEPQELYERAARRWSHLAEPKYRREKYVNPDHQYDIGNKITQVASKKDELKETSQPHITHLLQNPEVFRPCHDMFPRKSTYCNLLDRLVKLARPKYVSPKYVNPEAYFTKPERKTMISLDKMLAKKQQDRMQEKFLHKVEIMESLHQKYPPNRLNIQNITHSANSFSKFVNLFTGMLASSS